MIKETIKVANSAQESTGDVPTFISHKVSTLKTATILVNDLSYFLVISWKLLLMFVLINLCSVFCNIFEIICYKVVGYYVFGLLWTASIYMSRSFLGLHIKLVLHMFCFSLCVCHRERITDKQPTNNLGEITMLYTHFILSIHKLINIRWENENLFKNEKLTINDKLSSSKRGILLVFILMMYVKDHSTKWQAT